jgi:uncharacterized FlgJ-related protein
LQNIYFCKIEWKKCKKRKKIIRKAMSIAKAPVGAGIGSDRPAKLFTTDER